MSEYDLGDVLEEGVKHGHKYKVVQNPKLGHLCGYVKTNFCKPWDYGALRGHMGSLVDCHGGLTYGVDEKGFVGFDCAHAGDVCFVDGEKVTDHEMSARTEWAVEDVAQECKNVCRQIKTLEEFAERFDKIGWGDSDD